MLKNFVFPVIEKERAEFLQQNDESLICSSYLDCLMGRGSHLLQPIRFPDLMTLQA
jgi:hypothetical protein